MNQREKVNEIPETNAVLSRLFEIKFELHVLRVSYSVVLNTLDSTSDCVA